MILTKFRVGDRVRYLGPKEGETIPILPETAVPGEIGVITWISDEKGGLRYRYGVDLGETTLPLAEHEIEPA